MAPAIRAAAWLVRGATWAIRRTPTRLSPAELLGVLLLYLAGAAASMWLINFLWGLGLALAGEGGQA